MEKELKTIEGFVIIDKLSDINTIGFHVVTEPTIKNKYKDSSHHDVHTIHKFKVDVTEDIIKTLKADIDNRLFNYKGTTCIVQSPWNLKDGMWTAVVHRVLHTKTGKPSKGNYSDSRLKNSLDYAFYTIID